MDVNRRGESAKHWRGSGAKDPAAETLQPYTIPRKRRKTNAPSEFSSARTSELEPPLSGSGVDVATTCFLPSEITLDSSGRKVEYDSKDAVLSLRVPSYKSFMFGKFRQLDAMSSAEEMNKMIDEIFQMFKKRGGRIFGFGRGGRTSKELNDKEAIGSKCILFTCDRMLLAIDRTTQHTIII